MVLFTSAKKYINKIFEYLEDEDYNSIDRLIEEDKAEKYESSLFTEDLRKQLASDLTTLKQIQSLWLDIDSDPKLDEFIRLLKTDPVLKNSKLIVFTESKTQPNISNVNFKKYLGTTVLAYTGNSKAGIKEKIIENFDAKVRKPKNDIRILVSTEFSLKV